MRLVWLEQLNVIKNIDKKSILQSIEIMLNTHDSSKMELPLEYKIKNVSTRIIRLIQSYTPIVNKEIWKNVWRKRGV